MFGHNKAPTTKRKEAAPDSSVFAIPVEFIVPTTERQSLRSRINLVDRWKRATRRREIMELSKDLVDDDSERVTSTRGFLGQEAVADAYELGGYASAVAALEGPHKGDVANSTEHEPVEE